MICLFALITIWYGTPRHTVTVLQGQTPLHVPGHSPGGLRIVGLADLHGEMVGEKQERIAQKVREADPDFIVYLGDIVAGQHRDVTME